MGKRFKMGWSGGVNLLVDPNNIRPDQLASGKNCWPTVEGIMAKRPAIRALGTMNGQTGGGSVVAHYPLTLWKPDPSSGYDFILDVISQWNGNEALVALRLDENYYIPPGSNSSPYVEIALTSSYPGAPASLVNFEGRTIAVAGYEGYFQFYNDAGTWKFRRNSFVWAADTAGVTAAQSQQVSLQPRVACSYQGRMVYGNMGPGYENVIVFADRTPPVGWDNVTDAPPWAIVGNDVLAANGRHLRFSAIQGETIRAMVEISTSSVTRPLQTALLILTERSAIICTGEPTETSSTDDYLADFQFAKVNYDCGVAGAHAICRGPNGTFWANGEDVYALYDGEPRPVPIGTNIRPALQECPPALQPFWHMAYSNGAVVLAIATQDSTNEVLMAVDHWCLDLRPPSGDDVATRPAGPSQARWWGPRDYREIGILGGSGDDSINNERGVLSCAILADRRRDGKPYLVGTFRGDRNTNSDKSVYLVSFDEVEDGWDTPYRQVTQGRVWTASEYVSVGDVVMPTALRRTGRLYMATTSAANHLTSGTEPTWPTTNGATVVDGDITWTEITGAATNVRLPNYYGNTAPRVAMEPDFPEYDLGTHTQDKVFKRADLAAYLGLRQLVWLDCAVNGGNYRQFMGPAVVGDFSLGRLPARNDLGLATLDLSAPAEEYQARTLRAGTTVNERSILSTFIPSVVRGRSIQPGFRDGDGFIVDETNDYIIWASWNASGIQTVRQAQVTHGYYANIDTLLTAIITAMNSGGTLTGFTTAANPWSVASTFTGVFPYMTTVKMTFSARTAGHLFGFIGKNEDSDEITTGGVTYYVARCSSLLAMLGYDTGEAYNTASAIAMAIGGVTVNAIPENTAASPGASPASVCGVQSIPYLCSSTVRLAEMEAEFHLKRGRPFRATARKS